MWCSFSVLPLPAARRPRRPRRARRPRRRPRRSHPVPVRLGPVVELAQGGEGDLHLVFFVLRVDAVRVLCPGLASASNAARHPRWTAPHCPSGLGAAAPLPGFPGTP